MARHASGRALALGLGALLLGAPVAWGATVSAFPEPTYTAADGERNHVTLGIRPFGPSIVTFSRTEDAGAPMSDGDGAGAGCEPVGDDFDCPLAAGAVAHATLGDLSDTAGVYFFELTPVSIAGGPGDDHLGGGALADELLGDAGDDTITAWGGDDRVNGDAGDDWIDGREGDDVLLGDAGHDHVIGGDGADELSGGPGIDLIESADGVADTVTCGDGDDVVRSDALDSVAADCEAVSAAIGAAELRRDVQADLRSITRSLSRVSLRRISSRRSIAHRFTPLTSGTLIVSWKLAAGTGPVLGVRRAEAVGVRPTVVRLRLRRAAKRRLRSASELQLVARAALVTPGFVVRARAPFSVTR
jgi:hemolysin type calcium-binding protein